MFKKWLPIIEILGKPRYLFSLFSQLFSSSTFVLDFRAARAQLPPLAFSIHTYEAKGRQQTNTLRPLWAARHQAPLPAR